jgi:nucleotide-binding universal stress UspA family protein
VKKVVIAYDGSPYSEAILEDLFRSGLPAELDATVVTIADVRLSTAPGQSAGSEPAREAAKKVHDAARQEIEASRTLVERACARLKQLFPKWRVRGAAFADSPAWGIVKEAAASKADLVVAGSHSRTPFQKFFLGSVAQTVAAEAPCSVHIARPRHDSTNRGLRILIAVDGSSDSQAAVQAVAAGNWPASSEFQAITVVDTKLQTAFFSPGVQTAFFSPRASASRPAQHPDSMDEWVCRMNDHAAQLLRDAGLKGETHILSGDPKQVILREAAARKADCIFLGARGLDHGDRLFLGSLASAVVTRAHCSVEIVRGDPLKDLPSIAVG